MKTLALVSAVVLASCGGGLAPSPSSPCSAFAQAYCAKEESCTKGTNLTRDWGDMGSCVTRETLSCTNTLAAPLTGKTTDLVEQCTAALPRYTCADFLAGNLAGPCNPTGPGAEGATCTFNAQCASGYCSNVRYANCGTCASPPPSGSSCATSNCGHDQSCVWNIGVVNLCEPYVSTGDACGASQDPGCSPGLTCAGASSTTGVGGICQPAVTTVGAACGSKNMGIGCDGSRGLWCIDSACVQVPYADDGKPCGYIGSGVILCKAGTCYSSAGPYFNFAGPKTGVCKAFAPDGAACDTVAGPGCLSSARCVTTSGATAGVCTVPTAAVSASCD